MAPHSDLPFGASFLSSLRQITNIAKALKASTSTFIHVSRPTRNKPCPPLRLHFPVDLLQYFDQFDISTDVQNQVKGHISEKISRLQQIMIESYQRTYIGLPTPLDESDAEHLRETFEAIYHQRHIPKLRQTVEKLANELRLLRKPSRPAFKAECTPLLENFFERNPYPSQAEKEQLAKQTSLSARQIDVWFQNHRTRARREGKCITKQSPSQRMTPPHDVVQTPSHSGCSPPQAAVESFNPLEPVNSPSSAFPAPFTHAPNSSSVRLPFDITWRRVATNTPLERPAANIDDLCSMFTRLVIKDASPRRRTSRRASQESWHTSRLLTPPKAPLFALDRSRSLYHSPIPSSLDRIVPPTRPSTLHQTPTTSRFSSYPPASLQPQFTPTGSLNSSNTETCSTPPIVLPDYTAEDIDALMASFLNDMSDFNAVYSQNFSLEFPLPEASFQTPLDPTPYNYVCDTSLFSLPSLSINLLPC